MEQQDNRYPKDGIYEKQASFLEANGWTCNGGRWYDPVVDRMHYPLAEALEIQQIRNKLR